ncbi:sugar ABC transporter substrate-binding protein [Candidatus Caldatribacterium saccharofermentans]|uniref:sugar ABC transporter substrate-binding protein n=1 Tax=Candidatus Caldatribacterium saccharofermentans TaxID=1454753 RepID=UPI003CFD0C81
MKRGQIGRTLVLCVTLIFCVQMAWAQEFRLADRIVEKVKKGEVLNFKVVYHNTGINFAMVLKRGVEEAAKEFGVNAEFTGPVEPNVEAQVAMIENFIASEVDGLAISNVSAEALNPVIEKAINAGIPTVSFNSDAPGSKRLAFFGQDLVQSGRTQAEILVEYMGTKGKVLIFSCDAAAAWSLDRERGVREVLAKYPDIQVLTTVNTGVEEYTAFAAIENALLANPDVAGIATLDAVTTPLVGRYILRNNLVGKIRHVGHDLLPETLQNIKAGATNASLSQDPFKQGYLPVKALYEFIVEGVPLQSVDTGVLRVDEKNVEEYLEKLERGEPVG